MKSQNKFKTELTIEESARLIELGVDAKLASKCLLYFCDEFDEPLASWDLYKENGKVFCAVEEAYGRSVESRIVSMNADFDQSAKEENPIFDLSDLLSILPKEIEYDGLTYGLNMWVEDAVWNVEYCAEKGVYDFLIDSNIDAPELIDALYQLLIWCLTENKINLKTNNNEK